MEEVLRFKIILDETYEVKSGKGTAVMILFHGESDCENFSGKGLPGGVDSRYSVQAVKKPCLPGTFWKGRTGKAVPAEYSWKTREL